MKANKRIRDPWRQSKRRLVYTNKDGVTMGTTTFPTLQNKVRAVPR